MSYPEKGSGEGADTGANDGWNEIVLCCLILLKVWNVRNRNPINSIFFLSTYNTFIIMILSLQEI